MQKKHAPRGIGACLSCKWMPREIGAFSALLLWVCSHSRAIRPFGLLGRGSLPVESLCQVARYFIRTASFRTNEWALMPSPDARSHGSSAKLKRLRAVRRELKRVITACHAARVRDCLIIEGLLRPRRPDEDRSGSKRDLSFHFAGARSRDRDRFGAAVK